MDEAHNVEPVDQADLDLATSEAPVAIPVDVQGPVRTQGIGSELTTCVSVNVGVDPQVAIPADPRRSRAVLIGSGEDFWFGPTATGVRGSTAGRWPAGVPLVLKSRTQIWVKSASSTTCVLTIVAEQLVAS